MLDGASFIMALILVTLSTSVIILVSDDFTDYLNNNDKLNQELM